MADAERKLNAQLPGKLHGLDHLRAMAITWAFLFHYYWRDGAKPAWLGSVVHFAWTSVDLFFVLSGFLISSQLFARIERGQTVSMKHFIIRRSFRILPVFLVTVAIYFLVPFFREEGKLSPLWKYLTFTQNFGLDIRQYGAFFHAWSLCVEEHFYLALPLILMALLRTKTMKYAAWIIAVLFVAGFFARMFSYDLYLAEAHPGNEWMPWQKFVFCPTYNRLDGLLTGVGIAAVYRFLPDLWNRMSGHGNYFLLLGLLILCGAFILCDDPKTFIASVFGFPLVTVGYGLLVIGAICRGSFLFKWRSRVLTFIATVSYSVYLTHKGIIHMTHAVIDRFHLDYLLVLFISGSACLGGAWLMHLVVEKPFMKLRDRLDHHPPPDIAQR